MKDINCTEIMIRIPDRIHYGIENGITKNGSVASQIVLNAVKDGIQLPKGHGRLIDADALAKRMTEYGWHHPDSTVHEFIDDDCPTIIEADKEDE